MPRSSALALTFAPGMTDPTAAHTADEVSALVARARDGDVLAFQRLYERSAGRVFAVCVRMTGDRDRARELAHDAFVRAWERLNSFRGEAQFDTWMHRLTVNVVLEARRSERRREARVGLAEDEGTERQMERAGARPAGDVLARVDLERAIAALPPNAREVFVLHDVEGYRHDEIAERMRLAPGTVRAHLHRARQLLMRMLSR
ncbi:MAG: RNA polymerase sigma factor [Gemmatimonadaceae bacterium]